MNDVEGQLLARAVTQWCRSEAGSQCIQQSDLPMRIKLEQAFVAGWEARGAMDAVSGDDAVSRERRRGMDRRNAASPEP